MAVMLTSAVALAQGRTVTGTVVYAGDNEPLAGATVQPVGGGVGVATDADGKFTLSVPATVKKLTVTYVGMIGQTVDITSTPMTIKLDNSSNDLDEVMVVAYGTSKKSAYTGSAAVVKAAKLEDAMVTNALDALKGNVPGVQLLSNNGQPGSSPTVLIRGVGSMSSAIGTEPLYVLDGMPFDGSISTLNTQDIESMTVLKDAAAAALYGARGANGVILITTKKGKDGEAKITLDARWGSNSRAVSNYNQIKDPRQHYELAYKMFYNGYAGTGYDPMTANIMANSGIVNQFGYQVFTVPGGQQLIGLNGKLNPNATLGYSNGLNYFTPDDWEDLSTRHGLRQEYNLTISGGSDRFNYYVSASYLDDEGIITASDYKRLATRATMDYQAKKWLKIGTNLAYNYIKSGYPSGQTSDGLSTNVFNTINVMAPIYPFFVRNADGSIMTNPSTGDPIYDYGNGDYTNGVARKGFMPGSNPAANLIYDESEVLDDVFNGTWYAQITPIDGLTVTGTIGYYLDNKRQHVIGNPYYGTYKGANGKPGGRAAQYNARQRGLNLQALANYRKTFWNVHNFDFLVGYESYDYNYEYAMVTGQNLYDPNSWAVDNTLDDVLRTGSGYMNDYATRGIFGRVNYDYDGKYFGSVSYRRDASSRFHPDHRWGNFFSVSAAWDIAKEAFMEDFTNVDMLKFKASFGQQGNDAIDNYYPYLDQYTLVGTDAWADGTLSWKGNPDITWETSNALNVGFDFSFFKGKIDGTIEYYQRQTSDMLYMRPVAPSNGYDEIAMNVGSMRNNGFEIDLNVRPIQTRDFNWTVNFNGTYWANKVLKLHPDLNGQLISGVRIYREGESMYQFNLVKYAGVNPENGKMLFWAKDEDGKEYKTENFDTANSNNRCATGATNPKFYGGFGTTLQYRGFDFGIQFSYQLGGKILDIGYLGGLNTSSASNIGRAFHADILDAWTPDNTNTNIPALNIMNEYNLADLSYCDFYLTKSDYLSLNNITLGYTLPGSLTSRFGIESIRVYGAAENVALWAKRKGLDPRRGLVGVNSTTYSAIRTISGGIKVVF